VTYSGWIFISFLKSWRSPLCQSNYITQVMERWSLLSSVQHFPCCVQAVAACSGHVRTQPHRMDFSLVRVELAHRKYMAEGDWTHDLGSDTKLKDPHLPVQLYNPGDIKGVRGVFYPQSNIKELHSFSGLCSFNISSYFYVALIFLQYGGSSLSLHRK
jgi:hypothetical protein